MTSQVKKRPRCRAAFDFGGHGPARAACYSAVHDRDVPALWRAAAPMAAKSPLDSGRPGARGEQLDAPPLVSRDRARAAEPGDGPALGRTSCNPVARPEHAAP